MADIDEDDGYSDDDLDALPSHDFLELQHQAIQSTQQQPVHVNTIPSNTTFEALPPPRNLRPEHGSLYANTNVLTHMQTSNSFQQPSSDYGDIDDEILDGEILDIPERALTYTAKDLALQHGAGEAAQRQSGGQQRYAVPPQLHHSSQFQTSVRVVPSRLAIEDSGYYAAPDVDETMLDAPADEEQYQLRPALQTDGKDGLEAKVEEVAMNLVPRHSYSY